MFDIIHLNPDNDNRISFNHLKDHYFSNNLYSDNKEEQRKVLEEELNKKRNQFYELKEKLENEIFDKIKFSLAETEDYLKTHSHYKDILHQYQARFNDIYYLQYTILKQSFTNNINKDFSLNYINAVNNLYDNAITSYNNYCSFKLAKLSEELDDKIVEE